MMDIAFNLKEYFPPSIISEGLKSNMSKGSNGSRRALVNWGSRREIIYSYSSVVCSRTWKYRHHSCRGFNSAYGGISGYTRSGVGSNLSPQQVCMKWCLSSMDLCCVLWVDRAICLCRNSRAITPLWGWALTCASPVALRILNWIFQHIISVSLQLRLKKPREYCMKYIEMLALSYWYILLRKNDAKILCSFSASHILGYKKYLFCYSSQATTFIISWALG